MNLIQNKKLAFSLFRFSIVILFLLLTSSLGFSQNAKKVVSLAPSITENIYLLDAQDKLIACTSYCTQAVEDGVQQIGSTVDVNIEKIFALQPDLVLTMELTKSQDLEAMKKLGLNVVMIPSPKSFEEICAQTLRIGKLIGAEQTAQSVITDAKLTVNSIKEKCIQRNSRAKIFFQIGANPIFTVLQNTFMDDFILMMNGENIANGLTKGTLTRESIFGKKPDIILIASMGGFGNEELKIWSDFKGINAVKNNKVFIISSETSCSPTPLNFAQALNDIYTFCKQLKDEVLIAVKCAYLSETDLIEFIENKPEFLELALDGRGVTEEIKSKADHFTKITKEKHPFKNAIVSGVGIEY